MTFYFLSFIEPFVFEEHVLFHFLLSVPSGLGVHDQVFHSFEQKSARAQAKKILLTEFPPEPPAQKQVKFHRFVPHVVFYQFCTNGSTPLNNGSTKAPDK